MTHRKIVLVSHPVGLPKPSDFRLEEVPVPTPEDGQVVVEHSHVGLSPAARIRMASETEGYSVVTPIGGHVHGAGVGRVVASRNEQFPVGSEVMAVDAGLQTHAVTDGSNLITVDTSVAPAPAWLGPLGNAGFTAYVGLKFVGQPKRGETLVVSSAAGPVGSMAVQLGRIAGCRVVGIAGGPEKCAKVIDTFGADACIDYHDPEFASALAEACPDGVDVYYDNVGGAVRDGVWPLLNTGGRVAVCGQISQYSRTAVESGPDWYPILTKSLTVKGFNWAAYIHALDDFKTEVAAWLADGTITTDEIIVQGLENAPQAFIDMLDGQYAGKVVIEL